ncbi:MAG TPA: cysteine desulfurase [Oscillatoriaceae cyanobacterium]
MSTATEQNAGLDVARIREDFPILRETINGHPLAYLDNAASLQMPQPVLDRLVRYQQHEHANVHRGVHTLSQNATEAYEGARKRVQHFIHAASEREIIYTRGTTDAINLVMHGYGRKHLKAGDEIILSAMEHHSNIVPWQMLAEEKGVVLKVIPMDDRGVLDMDAYKNLLSERTKLVTIVHVSNALGTINPVEEIVKLAHGVGAPVLVDGAQAAPHMPVDVQAIDCEWYAFSGHKMGAPTGIGVLYGKADWLEKMQPAQGGGDMILSVSFEKTTYNVLPYRFEAGTPPIMPAIGLGAAIEYLEQLGLERIARYEHLLLEYATEKFEALPDVRIIGTAPHKAAVLSFVVKGVHPHDVGSLLDAEGIAVRAGHHCAQPVMQRMGVPATVRASFAFYNTREEIDRLVAGVRRVQEIFA